MSPVTNLGENQWHFNPSHLLHCPETSFLAQHCRARDAHLCCRTLGVLKLGKKESYWAKHQTGGTPKLQANIL